MRLIDADALKDTLLKYNYTTAHNQIFRYIDEQPTAYDVDKVVEKLENEKYIHTENYNISFYRDYPEIKQRYKQVCGVIDKAIEIVKGGGADADGI